MSPESIKKMQFGIIGLTVLFLTVTVPGCSTVPPPFRLHSSSAVPMLPIVPKPPNLIAEDTGTQFSSGFEFQKGVSWDEQGRLGKSNGWLVPLGVWITHRFFFGAQLDIFETLDVDKDDKKNLGIGLETEYYFLRSEGLNLGLHLDYNTSANSNDTDSCKESNWWGIFKSNDSTCTVVHWSSHAEIGIDDYKIASILDIRFADPFVLKVVPGIRFTSVDGKNSISGTPEIYEHTRYWSYFVSTEAGLEWEKSKVFIRYGRFQNRAFGIKAGDRRYDFVSGLGISFTI